MRPTPRRCRQPPGCPNDERQARKTTLGGCRLLVDSCQLWQLVSRSTTQTVGVRDITNRLGVTGSSKGGGVNNRFGDAAILSPRVRYINGHPRDTFCNDFTYPQKARRQQNFRPSNMTIVSEGHNAGSPSVLQIALRRRAQQASDRHCCANLSHVRDLRKRPRRRPAGASTMVPGACCHYCAPVTKESKICVRETSHCTSDVGQSCFAQLRLIEITPDCTATVVNLLTETKRLVLLAPRYRSDRFAT